MNTLKSNLDNTDWAILRELQQDARLSFAEIGRRVGLSSPAVQERIHKLEEAEIIEGYQAKLNFKRIGLPIMAFARVSDCYGEHIEAVARIAEETAEVLHCYHLIGQDEYLIQLIVPSVERLNSILRQFTPHGNSVTSIVTLETTSNRIISPDSIPYLEESDS
jgi:Lrp/AsnC family leucine-responsive transcriptional regulator